MSVSPRLPPRPQKPPVSPPFGVTLTPPRPLPRVRVRTNSPEQAEGFGVSLQSCYEAINKRHEDELKALESLRVHIFNRAKADREYTELLAKINVRANRGVATINQSSAIVQAWICYLEMSDAVQKQISLGAIQMSGVLLQRVDQLIRDKRGAKKVFDTERARLDEEYHSSCNELQSLRRDYQRFLTSTENYKRKLEGALAKESNPKIEKDQERYRKKFVANAEKLHSCHNDYTLSILNTNAHQDHFRRSLLPFCMDTLQQRMQLQIAEWKDALLQYAKALDLSEVYEESFRRLYDSLRQVEEEEEYVQFIKENKKEQPEIECFEFDASLMQGYCSPKAHPGSIVVNNLTHNNMKTRLASLESDLEQHETTIAQKRQELQELIASPVEENGSISPKADGNTNLPRHVLVANLRSQIKEVGSKVARKKGQAKLIREGVGSLREAVPPLFDPLGEGVDVKDLEAAVAATGGTGSASARGKNLAMGTLRHIRVGMKGLFKTGKQRGRIPSSSSTSSAGDIARSNSQDILGDGVGGEAGGEDSDSDLEDSMYDLPPEIPVEEEDWFFGDIDRRLAESKCKNRGDFLVRYSARQNKYVLTCNWNGQGKHFVIQQFTDESGKIKYRFESKAFSSIRELLDYHVNYGTPVTRASQAIIQFYVTKYDKWSLRHDDVKLGKKIGKGCFGDVYEGTLVQSNDKVAVKTCRSDTLQDVDKFMKEAEILKQYDHPNIVKLIGVCAEKEPVYIVMELMPGGSFLDFLRKKSSHHTKKKLCLMCVDASHGMAYLASKNCIHRDLAARNCLVGENDVVKISDFGMSREEEGGVYTVSQGTRAIPIKWTGPEALNYGKYTSASDVWSFGVLLWEAFSCGSAPYPGMSNHDARSQVEVGYRMPPPADCPPEVYGVMQQCWQYDADERPEFATIVGMLQQAAECIRN